MKQKLLLLLSLFVITASQVWGQTTVTGQFSDFGFANAETSPSGDLDENISFTTEKNNSNTVPTYYTSGGIRFYPGNGNGGSITLHVGDDAIITSVKFFSSQKQPVVYSVDGGANISLSASSTYEITGINASSTIKLINANGNTSGSSNQLRLTGVTVTYEFATTDPILNTSETEITGLGYMEGSASVSQSFSLSGMNLDPASGNITVTAPANFQVSTDDVSFNNSLNIAYTDGALAATDIYVRLNGGLIVGNYNGDITISGGSANAIVSVEGVVTEFSSICGLEDFTNATELPTGSSYGGGTFTGNNDIVWSYHGQSAGDYEIDGNGFLLRRASDSYLEATIPNGVGEFSFEYRKAYTGNNSRQLELLINDSQVAISPEFGSGSGADATVYTFTHTVNVEGEVTIRIKLTGNADTNRHVTIDNITWTCYSGTQPTTPTLTTSVSELIDFVYGLGSGPSASQSFALSGTNLDGSEDITILAGDGFEISLDDVDYFEEETLSAYDGTATDIYVRLKAGLTVGNYYDIILIDGYETDATVNISGEVTAPVSSLFRSKADGNWTSNATWESSADGTEWWPVSTYPDESATDVVIRENHKVILNSADIKIANTEVYGQLEIVGHDFQLMGTDHALKIKNGAELILDGSGKPTNSSTGTALIETGGNFKVVSFSGSNNLVSNYLHVGSLSNKFKFEHHSIFEWANTNTLGSSGFEEIFDVVNPGNFVIFRMTETFGSNYGGSTNNSFNAVLEIPEDRLLKLQGNGNKTFRGGIQGTGTLTVEIGSGSGKLIFGDTFGNPTLGNTGSLTLNVPHTVLQLQNIEVPSSAQVKIESSGTGNPNTLSRIGGNLAISGELDITDMRITNTADGGISVNNGGTIRTSHSGGLFGSGSAIPSNTDKLTLNEGSTVEYYATENQTISTGKEYYHLKLSGAATKTPQSTTNVHTNGSVSISGTTTVDYTSYNLASTSSNSTAFNMDGGRLILGTTGTQPNMGGTYTISGGTVEFVNNGVTAQAIRGGSSIQYFQIEVSGSNVKNSTGNIWIKNGGGFIVNSGGIFEISGANSIRCQTSEQCGVLIDDNAVFRVGNGDGFYGTNSAAIALDISEDDILLGEDSVIEFFRTTGNQKLSPFTPGYENIKVSGNAVTMEANVEIHNNLELTAAADLTVLSTSDENPPIVLTVNGGIDVATGGQLTFQNNAQLMQDEDAVNSGEMTMHRLFTLSEGRQQYNYVISPVSGQTIKTIYPDAPFVIKLNEPTNWFLDAGVGDYIPGKAYGIKEPTAAVEGPTVTGIMSGGFVNGLVEFELSRTPDAGGQEYGSNLVGNPYPSALDLDLFYIENEDNIGTTIWLWDNRGNTIYEQQGSGYIGSNYAFYNVLASTGTAASGASGTLRTPNEYVKPGTGFIVDAETGADGENLVFTNEMRTTETGPGFFGKASVTKDRYWLNLKTPAGLNIQTAVVYFPGGNNELWLDDSDARYGSDDLYSLVNDNQLSIQGKAPFEQRDRVPLGVRLFNTGVYVLSVDKIEGLFEEGQTIYLRDRQTKTIYNLSERPYKFVGYAGEFNNRFEILYRKTTLDELSAVAIGGRISIDKINHQIAVSSTLDKIEKVEVFNLSGRLIYEKSNINRLNYEIPVEEFSKQIIIVRTTSEKGEIVSKKFVNK